MATKFLLHTFKAGQLVFDCLFSTKEKALNFAKDKPQYDLFEVTDTFATLVQTSKGMENYHYWCDQVNTTPGTIV